MPCVVAQARFRTSMLSLLGISLAPRIRTGPFTSRRAYPTRMDATLTANEGSLQHSQLFHGAAWGESTQHPGRFGETSVDRHLLIRIGACRQYYSVLYENISCPFHTPSLGVAVAWKRVAIRSDYVTLEDSSSPCLHVSIRQAIRSKRQGDLYFLKENNLAKCTGCLSLATNNLQ